MRKKPKFYGKGCIGVGKHSLSTSSRARNLWGGLLKRCFCNKYHKTKPTYKGITVCGEWLDF